MPNQAGSVGLLIWLIPASAPPEKSDLPVSELDAIDTPRDVTKPIYDLGDMSSRKLSCLTTCCSSKDALPLDYNFSEAPSRLKTSLEDSKD